VCPVLTFKFYRVGAPYRAPVNNRSHSREGGDDAVPLADLLKVHKPQIPLAIIGTGGGQGACLFQIDHKGVDGALVTARIQTHCPHKVGAGLGAIVDQAGADGGADDGCEHRSGVGWARSVCLA